MLQPVEIPRKADLLLLALAGALLFLPYLGLRDVWTSGEARVAQVARQMRFSGKTADLIVPQLGDDERLKKPPLAYWLTAAASLPFADVDEFNSRLPDALAAICTMLLIYLLGTELAGRNAGLLAALALGTTCVFWEYARTTGIELPLLLFNTAAFFAWWKAHAAAPEKGGGWLAVCYGALGLSVMQKGPVGPALLLCVVAVYLTAAGGWSRRPLGAALKWHALGLLLFLAIILPWPLAVLWQMPEAWETWTRESVGRFKGFDHLEGPLYFVFKVLGDGQPWVLAALLAPLALRGECDSETRRRWLFPLCWAALTLVFFSIPASKKSYYVMPIYPALALLAGIVFAAAQRAPQERLAGALRRLLQIAGALLLAGTLAGGAALALQASGRAAVLDFVSARTQINSAYALHLPQLAVCLAAAGALGYALLRYGGTRRFIHAAAATVVAMCAFFALNMALTPTLNRHKGDKLSCKWLHERLGPKDRVFTYGLSGHPIITFYCSSGATLRPVNRLDSPGSILQKLDEAAPGEIYVMTDRKDLAKLNALYEVRALLRDGEDAEAAFVRLAAAFADNGNIIELARGESPAALPAKSGGVLAAKWLLVGVQTPGKDGKQVAVRDPRAALIAVREALGGMPALARPLAEHMELLDQPEWESGSLWARLQASVIQKLPGLGGAGER